MFDINSLALKDTFKLHLRHPVTEELLYADEKKQKPVAINIYGTSSKQYRNAVAAMQNRSLKRGKKQATAEQLREEGTALLVAISESAENLAYNGKPVASEAQFSALYEDPAFSWLREQVDAAVADVGNFLGQ